MARAVTMHGGEFTQCVYHHRVDLRYASISRSLLFLYQVSFFLALSGLFHTCAYYAIIARTSGMAVSIGVFISNLWSCLYLQLQ